MIIGLGIDTVEISRFQRFIDENNTPLLNRLFTRQEQEYCSPRKNSAASFAARFAAKEAFLKALGTGLRDGISWTEIEVINMDNGRPELHLSGTALQFSVDRGSAKTHLSISHDGNSAVAVVIMETE